MRDKKVLIVDDDMRNVFAMTVLLERVQAEVVYAESGFAALETLTQNRDFDVVLMDIMMPIMDGYQTIRAIRKALPDADLPIIAVTGKVVTGEREHCLAAGADGYIPKPINSADLLTALEPWLPRTRRPRHEATAPSGGAAAGAAPEPGRCQGAGAHRRRQRG